MLSTGNVLEIRDYQLGTSPPHYFRRPLIWIQPSDLLGNSGAESRKASSMLSEPLEYGSQPTSPFKIVQPRLIPHLSRLVCGYMRSCQFYNTRHPVDVGQKNPNRETILAVSIYQHRDVHRRPSATMMMSRYSWPKPQRRITLIPRQNSTQKVIGPKIMLTIFEEFSFCWFDIPEITTIHRMIGKSLASTEVQMVTLSTGNRAKMEHVVGEGELGDNVSLSSIDLNPDLEILNVPRNNAFLNHEMAFHPRLPTYSLELPGALQAKGMRSVRGKGSVWLTNLFFPDHLVDGI
ncbi:hypothetical protein Tco_0659036 [Tanacetum coccineum]